jgi:hypothetical protein
MIRNRFFMAILLIVVTDSAFSNAQVFDPEGNALFFIGRLGPRPGQVDLPEGIAIDENDRIYMADQLNGRVQVFQYLKDALPGRTR